MSANPTDSRAPERSDFRFFDRLRVRWAEVDMQKIVFNGHYLMYFDTAVAAYWRALALPYHDTMHALQGDLYVRKATLEYEGSARYDEVCDVGLRCARIGNSSMLFRAAVFRGDQRLVHGELVYVFADPATQTSRPVPPALRAVLEDFEAGAEMLQLQAGGWGSLQAQIVPLRQAIAADEQPAPASLNGDEEDPKATHVLARNRLGLAVGCGRLVALPGGQGAAGRVGEISHLAVLPAVRGAGIGHALLQALLGQARQQGLQRLQINAARSAVGFFARRGFQAAKDDQRVLARLNALQAQVPMTLDLG